MDEIVGPAVCSKDKYVCSPVKKEKRRYNLVLIFIAIWAVSYIILYLTKPFVTRNPIGMFDPVLTALYATIIAIVIIIIITTIFKGKLSE